MGYGVIGSPTGSGPVSLGSSPSTPAIGRKSQPRLEFRSLRPPLCSGLARRPLKAVAPVRIRSGVPAETGSVLRRRRAGPVRNCRLTHRLSEAVATLRVSQGSPWIGSTKTAAEPAETLAWGNSTSPSRCAVEDPRWTVSDQLSGQNTCRGFWPVGTCVRSRELPKRSGRGGACPRVAAGSGVMTIEILEEVAVMPTDAELLARLPAVFLFTEALEESTNGSSSG
jgi:hypothetical protein